MLVFRTWHMRRHIWTIYRQVVVVVVLHSYDYGDTAGTMWMRMKIKKTTNLYWIQSKCTWMYKGTKWSNRYTIIAEYILHMEWKWVAGLGIICMCNLYTNTHLKYSFSIKFIDILSSNFAYYIVCEWVCLWKNWTNMQTNIDR